MNLFQRNKVPLLLMVVSLLLLVTFQVFWLRKEFSEQKSLLQKEADLLFRTTVRALEDSVLQQKITVSLRGINLGEEKADLLKTQPTSPQKTDSLVLWKGVAQTPELHDGLPELVDRKIKTTKIMRLSGDSLSDILPSRQVIMRDSAKISNIEIRIAISSDNQDSLKQIVPRILKPVQSMVRTKRNEPQPDTITSNRFVFRLGNDSLNLGELHTLYGQQLEKAGLGLLPFKVGLNAVEDSIPNVWLTSVVASSMPTNSEYSATLMEYQPHLYQKITPQILFSVFFIAITTLAFGVIYQNMQRQTRLIALKNEFISNVTHELKTPIATVRVALEALQNFGAARDPEKMREYLAISKNELDRLTMLVDKVLKTSQFEQHSLILSPEPLDADQLVQQVLHTMKPQFEKYGAQCNFERDGKVFGLIADRVHLTNVLFNLLDNALKYSDAKPNISVRLAVEPHHIRLEVADQGIGIAEIYRDKIFEKFFRVPSGNIHNVKGYGLGLSYVCSVVKSHGGRIEVRSKIGLGSCFTLWFPTSSPPTEMTSNTIS